MNLRAASDAQLIAQQFAIAAELERRHGRPFSPDGHMIGSIGEVLAAERFALTLQPPSNEGFDASDQAGRRVEVKTTTGQRGVAITGDEPIADRLVVLQLRPDGTARTVYDGPAGPAWALANRPSKTGQRHLSLAKLRVLELELEEGR
ncbi:MAG: hypothetical protein AAFX65_08020 [Cyanobacteria bacterium J06638_7]